MLIGVVWGIWLAPLILQGHNYPDNPVLGVAFMTIFCVLLSPLFAWVALKCRSAIAAGVMHGVFNASAGFSIIYLSEQIELVTSIMGVLGFLSLGVANLLLFIIGRPDFSGLDWYESSLPKEAQR